MDVENNLNRLQEMMNLINSNHDPPVDLYHLEGSEKGDNEIDSLTKEPSDTLLMGDEIISTTPARENDEFIKSSVDNLVPIPRESEEKLDIDLLLGEQLDTLSTRDREIDFNPIRDIEELERLLADDPVPVPRVFDDPLGNSDSMSRSSETKSDILFFEQLLNEDSFSDESSALLPIESSLLVPPLPGPKHICLGEVERFDPFFSLTQSGGKTRVMKTPSLGFQHMSSPYPTAYLPKEVMYRFYHPHHTSGDGFDHEMRDCPDFEASHACGFVLRSL
ncbi:hypothetical protein Tco_1413144 [Tanacetum coccineum]